MSTLESKMVGGALLFLGGILLNELPFREYAGIGLVAMGCAVWFRRGP